MLKRLTRWLPLPLVAALGMGCNGGNLSLAYHDHRPPPPRRSRNVHVCTRDCRHHHHDGRKKVVVKKGHRDGCGPGHYRDGERCVAVGKRKPRGKVVRPPPKAYRARRAPAPSHNRVFDRATGKWIAISKDHVHGPGCGHVYINGRWCTRR